MKRLSGKIIALITAVAMMAAGMPVQARSSVYYGEPQETEALGDKFCGPVSSSGDGDSQELEPSGNPGSLYGGSVSFNGITAEAVSEETEGSSHKVKIHIEPSEGLPVSTGGFSWGLFSQSENAWALNGTNAAVAEDPAHSQTDPLGMEGCDIELTYTGDAKADYSLTCLKLDYRRTALGGIGCSFRGVEKIMLESMINDFEVSGTQEASDVGSHVFIINSNACSSTETVTVRTDASGKGLEKKFDIDLTMPEVMPRGISVGFFHAYWAKDGRIMLSGIDDGENYIAAAYDPAGRMLETVLLENNLDGAEYNYLSGQLNRKSDLSQIRIFSLDGHGAPLREAFERPEILQIDKADVGQAWGKLKAKGYATVSIEGTDTEGDVSLQTAYGYPEPEDTNEIAVVEALIDGGEGELDGVAEIRVKYIGDEGICRQLIPDQLLAGYYNKGTGEWETVPFFVDEESHEVIIPADHFSTWGVFEIDGVGTRNAFIKGIDANRFSHMEDQLYKKLLKPYEDAAAAAEVDFDTTEHVVNALDGNFNSRWFFAPGVADTWIQNHASEAAKANPWAKGLNRSMSVIGLVGACLSVANKAYTKGFKDAETIRAMLNLGKTAGVSAASAPVQWAVLAVDASIMVYEYIDEREQKQTEAKIDKAYKQWKSRQSDWPETLKEWRKLELDPRYNKYVTNGPADKSMPDRYNSFMSAVKSRVHYYPFRFYEEWMSGSLKKDYPDIVMPEYDPSSSQMTAVYNTCYNAETEILRLLSPYFKEQARKHYLSALREFEAYCLREQERLNQRITIHLVEDIPEGGESIAKNYTPVLLGTDVWEEGQWGTPGFDEKGRADMTFTGLALAMGRGEIHFIDNQFMKWKKTLVLREEELDFGGESTVHFNMNDVLQTFHVHEKTHEKAEEYVYAGYGLRLRSQDGKRDDRTFTLDEKGSTIIELSGDDFYDHYAPKDGTEAALEILYPDSGAVVNSVPFSIFKTDVILEPDKYVVNISCENKLAKDHFMGARAELSVVSDRGKKVVCDSARIRSDGTACLTVSSLEYEFNKSEKNREAFYLNITPLGQKYAEIGLRPSFNDMKVWDAVLSYQGANPDQPLSLSDTYVTIVLDDINCENPVPVKVLSGEIGSVYNKNPEEKGIATGTRNYIRGNKAGVATIVFTDNNYPDNMIEVTVNVISHEDMDSFGIYRVEKIYEEKHTREGVEINDCPEAKPSYVTCYLNALFRPGVVVDKIYGVTQYMPYGIKLYESADPSNPAEGLRFDTYETKYKPLNDYEEFMYLYAYDSGDWTTGVETWNKNMRIDSATNGAALTVTHIQKEPDAGLFYLEERYQYSRTQFKNLQDALYFGYLEGEIEVKDMRLVEGSAGAEAVSDAAAGKTGGAMGAVDIGASAYVTESSADGILAVAYGEDGQNVSADLVSASTGGVEVLEPDENGRYTLSCNVTPGSLYSLIALDGDYDSFPDEDIKTLRNRIRYLDVKPAESDRLSFTFIPQKGGKLTLFLAEKGSEPGRIARIDGEEEDISYTVSFSPEGGKGEMKPVTVDCADPSGGADYVLPQNGFDAPAGKAFDGWNLGKAGDSVKIYEDTVLRAMWKEVPPTTWTLSFHPNGGKGSMDDMSFSEGEEKALTKSSFTRDGYTFQGWNRTWYDEYAQYTDEEVVSDLTTPGKSLTLYAVWKEAGKDPDPFPDAYEEVPEKVKNDSTKVSKLKFEKKTLKIWKGDDVSNPGAVTEAKNIKAPAVTYVTTNRKIVAVTSDGVFHAVGTGTAEVTAYCGNKRAVCKVSVVNSTEKISLLDQEGKDQTDKAISMNGGEQQVFTVSFSPADATDPRKVTWSSSNKKVAVVSGGLVTAKEVTAAGTADIIATVKYTDKTDGKKKKLTAKFTVNVNPVAVPGARKDDKTHALSLKKSSVKMETWGDKSVLELEVFISPKEKDTAIGSYEIVSFSSTNTGIFDVESVSGVSPDGKKGKSLARLTAVGNGTAYLIVESRKKGSEDASKINVQRCKVTVTSPVQSVLIQGGFTEVDAATGIVTMRQGKYASASVKINPAACTDIGKIKWSASGGVKVDNGLVYANKITKPGKPAVVTVSCGKQKHTVKVCVV